MTSSLQTAYRPMQLSMCRNKHFFIPTTSSPSIDKFSSNSELASICFSVSVFSTTLSSSVSVCL